jgi:hypothetical protein
VIGSLRVIHKRTLPELVGTLDTDSLNGWTSEEEYLGSNAEWLVEFLPYTVSTTLNRLPELVKWAFSHAGPPNLTLVACGNFSYKGRYINTIQTHRSVTHVENSATSIGHNSSHIVSSFGHDVMKEEFTDDVWSFLGAAPISLLFGTGAEFFNDHDRDHDGIDVAPETDSLVS